MQSETDDVLRRWLTEAERACYREVELHHFDRNVLDTIDRLASLLDERQQEWVKCSEMLPDRDGRNVWWGNSQNGYDDLLAVCKGVRDILCDKNPNDPPYIAFQDVYTDLCAAIQKAEADNE